MVGIKSYGAYIPLHRIDRAEFQRAWGGFGMPGEKSVGNFDEDSVTMAVESALDCLNGTDPKAIDSLLFATTTSPLCTLRLTLRIACILPKCLCTFSRYMIGSTEFISRTDSFSLTRIHHGPRTLSLPGIAKQPLSIPR